MKTLIAIDPGKHGLGVALFGDGSLIAAKYSGALGGQPHVLLEPLEPFEQTFAEWRQGLSGSIDSIVIERPQQYTGAQAGNAEDISDLTIVVGALVRAVAPFARGILLVLPAQWKGQTPKDITRKRAESALSADEKAGIEVMTWRGEEQNAMHNVWDAIALGLWHEGRILKR